MQLKVDTYNIYSIAIPNFKKTNLINLDNPNPKYLTPIALILLFTLIT